MKEYEIYLKGHFDRETGKGCGCYAVYNGNPEEAVLKSKHFDPKTRKSAPRDRANLCVVSVVSCKGR